MYCLLYFVIEVIYVLAPIFFKEKPVNALAQLADDERSWYASMLAKEIDCTYPHIVNILDKFHEHDLIETEEEGRVKKITLTSQGEDLAIEFQNLLRRMDRIDEKTQKSEEADEGTEEE